MRSQTKRTTLFYLFVAVFLVFFAFDIEAKKIFNGDTQCENDLNGVFNNSYHKQGNKMIAASGLIPGDWGDYDSCVDESLVDSQYCFVSINGTTHIKGESIPCATVIPFCSMGLCVPTSCSADNLTHLLDEKFKFLRENNYTVNCITPNKWDWSNYFALVVLGVLVTLSFIGTIWDLSDSNKLNGLIPCYRRGDELDPSLPSPDKQTSSVEVINDSDTKGLLRDETVYRRSPSVSKLAQFFQAFSFTTNFVRLLAPIPGDFGALNGIRVLSMFWIILGHTFDFLSEVGVMNLGYFLKWSKTWQFQFILNTPLSVDTFFLLSGFLLGFFVLKELYAKGKLSLPLFYFHRFWRLLPLYSFLILMYSSLIPIVSNGPVWFRLRADISASNPYCWTNILFINNFYPKYQDMCMRWSWFLADDMQFYLISPIFLFSYFYNQLIGWGILALFFIASIISNFVLYSDCTDCAPTMAGEARPDFFNNIYSKPYTRIAPFIIGLAAAFLLHKLRNTQQPTKNKYVRLSWPIQTALYIFAFFLLLSCLYGTYQSTNWDPHGARSLMYESLSRSCFSLGVAILVMLFSMGYGGIINSILAAKFWDPFAKLTYAAYLIHPMILRSLYYSQIELPGLSYLSIAYWFSGTLVISYMLASIAYCLVEKAFMNLEGLILPKRH